MNFTDRIKNDILAKYDMDLVGVAPASALAGEPEGHRPEDLLRGSKSIIVFARSLADGAVQHKFRAREDGNPMAHSGYESYTSDLAANFLLMNDTFNIAAWIEDAYKKPSLPLPFSNVQQSMVWDNAPAPLFADPYGQGMPLDVFKAAMAAGLGEFGWSNRFVTPQYGPRQILSAVLTTLELEPDAPYSGERLCDPAKCGICAKVCPTKAIAAPGSGSVTVKSAGGKTCETAKINVNACTVAALGLRGEFLDRAPDMIMTNDPSDEELRKCFEKRPILASAVEHFPRCLCDKCLVYCPLGNWKERFGDTGLSKFKADEIK